MFFAVCIFLLAIPISEAVKGGTAASVCDYPGIATLYGQNKEILCTGVITTNKVFNMPPQCALVFGMLMAMSLNVDNGFRKWIIPQGSNHKGSTTSGGIYQVDLAGFSTVQNAPAPTGCTETFGKLFDGTDTLDTSKCYLAGFGAATKDGAVYDIKNLKAAQITKSTGAECCSKIVDSLSTDTLGIGYFKAYPNNCFISSGAPCSIGDLGAPVMCGTTGGSGQVVTIALTSSTPCLENKTFLGIDVTGSSSSKTKFGYDPVTAV